MSKTLEAWADLLVRQGRISIDELQEADQMARAGGLQLEDYLDREGLCDLGEIQQAKAEVFGMDYIDLEGLNIAAEVFSLLPHSQARAKQVLVYDEDEDSVSVAVADPLDLDLIEELKFTFEKRVRPALANPHVLRDRINILYTREMEAKSVNVIVSTLTTAGDATQEEQGDDEDVTETSAPIIKLVHSVINEAVKMRASDIHIEPFEDRVRIRYRIDGQLIERDRAPKKLQAAIISRVKILSKIDIAERRRPQDGRIKVTVGTKELDLRVSVLPSSHGQSIVMRLLDKDNIKVRLPDLGFAKDDYETFSQYIRRPNGIILVTGPTGSGKTTTLYAALNELNRPDRKIITAEDPVEYYLSGINQVEVRHNIGLDFARIIKSMLRQAPNVILVGEIRDRETAEMAIQASLTGHLVFSTLHTNDAPGAITRLIDIGVPPYLVATSVICVMAQRLVRMVCPDCKQPFRPSDVVLQQAGIPLKVVERANFAKGKGCAKCQRGGYKGRKAIFELMQVNSKIRELTYKGASTQEIRKMAVTNGMKTLYHDGMIKALKGLTTIEEVWRVAGKKAE